MAQRLTEEAKEKRLTKWDNEADKLIAHVLKKADKLIKKKKKKILNLAEKEITEDKFLLNRNECRWRSLKNYDKFAQLARTIGTSTIYVRHNSGNADMQITGVNKVLYDHLKENGIKFSFKETENHRIEATINWS